MDSQEATLDLVANLPRSTFSDRQLKLMLWLLRSNLVQDVPSVDQMKEMQKGLQGLSGISTLQYAGKLGHTYYLNSFPDMVKQVISGRLVT